MNRTLSRFTTGVCPWLLPILSLTATHCSFAADPPRKLTYEEHIRPIFREHCFDCHGATDEIKGGLDLRLVRFMLKGGESGAAIVSEKPDESYLVQRLRNGEMPPGENRVPDHEIDLIARWIQAGAPTSRPEPKKIGSGLGVTPEERQFWSFQPITRPDGPETHDPDRVRTPVDAFVLDAMPDGLSFAADADRFTLIKRVYFDLIGLPPSPDDVQKWMTAPEQDWYSTLIDELLESDHYGERWARHWLDVAGYADSEGYTVSDANRDWAWKYRDWVIRALNDDKPFDRFITEQLAGDELAGPQQGDLTNEQIDLLTAVGFLRMAPDGTGSGADNDDGRNQTVADTLRIVSTSLLGVSVHCAQCHDHRYDPIPQTDYYSLRAVFEPALDWKAWKNPQQRRVSLYTAADRQKAAEIEADVKTIADERAKKQAEYMAQALEAELKKYNEPLRTQLHDAYKAPGNKRTDEQKALLKKHPSININPGNLYQYIAKSREELGKFDNRIKEIRAKKKPEQFLRTLVEPTNHVPETKLFHRGDHKQPKQTIVPASLTIAAPEGERRVFDSNSDSLPSTGRRLAFARWLTGGRHPLVARVIVNRVWLHHFGIGIVDTPSDFGKLGTRPTHPELLDWLADEFMKQGWSLKELHRLIMSSTVYRQSGDIREIPDANRAAAITAYARKPLIRLEAETLRDRFLAASGSLDRSLFGAPVAIKEDDSGQVVISGNQTRRSLYVRVRRSQPVAMLHAFDAPVMETNCERRSVSTVATQSLMLMNSGFALDQANRLASRAGREAQKVDGAVLATLPPIPEPPASHWQYGYGRIDDAEGRLASFKPLPFWTGSVWRGGAKMPDPELGHVMITADGGHTGPKESCPIRRWTAPATGVMSVTGSLQHGSPSGDGVRGRIVSSRSGVAGDWKAFNNSTDTKVEKLAVEKGDAIDFVVDNNGTVTSDSFTWKVTVTLTPEGSDARTFVSAEGFQGPALSSSEVAGHVVRAWELALCRRPTDDELRVATGFLAEQIGYLDKHTDQLPKNVTARQQAMTNLCQTLLSCNEFLYID